MKSYCFETATSKDKLGYLDFYKTPQQAFFDSMQSHKSVTSMQKEIQIQKGLTTGLFFLSENEKSFFYMVLYITVIL